MSWFARKKSAGRRVGQVAVRGFQAAVVDRLLAAWRYDGGFTPQEISQNLHTIRSRSREMAKNNPHFRRWLQLIETNVVGEGFVLKSQPHDTHNGETTLDQKAAKFIEAHWWKFCTYRDATNGQTWFDFSGVRTEAEMDRLAAKTWARDGEYFIQIVRNAPNPYGISFRMLRPDWCDEKYNVADTGHGTMIHAGIEIDMVTRRPVRYWFIAPPSAVSEFDKANGKRVPIEAADMIHGFTQDDEGQPRGIPWGHAAMVKLKMLEEYDRAELTAARDEACTVRTYEAADANASPDEFVDLSDPANVNAAAALTADKEPGQSEIVPRGYSMKVHTPAHPNRELTAFKASMLRDVACGFGLEYANFANDWSGVSFSSVRAGTISERDGWKVIQQTMISQMKTVQFLAWIKSFLSLSISGQLPASKIDKFAEHEFRGRRWMWVDPMKDIASSVIAVNQRWKSNTDIAADMGTDYFDNVEQIKREEVALRGSTKESVPILNGAQIASALLVVQGYANGEIAEAAAVALLTAAGVPAEAAKLMIASQPVAEKSEDNENEE